MKIKVFSIRFLITLLTLAIGVIAVVLWVVPRFRTVTTPHPSVVSETLSDEEISLPEGWRRLEITAGPPRMFRDVQQPEASRRPETRGRITIGLPPDMEPEKLEGDSIVYREAYRNRDISIVIGYGEIVTSRNEGDRPLNPCETTRSLLGQPTYRESIVDVDGRRAKLWVDRSNQPEFTTAGICFPPDDQSVLLTVRAEYKNDRALEIASRFSLPLGSRTKGYAYLPDRIIYLRSEDCLSSQNSTAPVTEVWLIPEGVSLPSHVEAVK